MRPNTLHAVFTPKHSICHGGHFYCTSTMQDTARAMVHSFVDHIKITNTNHPAVAALLRRIATFYHFGLVKVGRETLDGEFHCCTNIYPKLNLSPEPEIHHIPDPATINGALDLMSLCFLVIFGNALDFRTYCVPNGDPVQRADKHDVNNISVDERVNMCIARGTCMEILRWWNSKYSISTPTLGEHSFSDQFMFAEATVLLVYKQYAEADKRPGAPGCVKVLLWSQIVNVLDHLGIDRIPHGQIYEATHHKDKKLKMGFSPADAEKLTVIRRDPPQKYGIEHPSMT
jgi:hypothetical protein